MLQQYRSDINNNYGFILILRLLLNGELWRFASGTHLWNCENLELKAILF